MNGTAGTSRWIGAGLAALVLLVPKITWAEQQFDLALGVEYMGGTSTYAIGGKVILTTGEQGQGIFPMSTLEWPLDIWLARLEGGWNLSPALRLNGVFKANLNNPKENIIDRDWMTPSRPWQLDVYSESQVDSLAVRIADVNLEWTFHQQDLWNLYGGFGYQYQQLEYDGIPLYQYSPSGLPGYQYRGSGELGLTYDLSVSMLYLLIGSDYQLTPQLRLTGSLAYAPWVGADDTTRLPLRNKVSDGDMDGYAYMADISGIYYFLPKWFFEAGFQYTYISTDGTQQQSLAGRPLGTLEMEAETKQSSGYLTVGYTF